MKLSDRRIDFGCTLAGEVLTSPEDMGLPLLFGVDEGLTDNPSAMDMVSEMPDEVETLAEKAKTAIEAVLAGESSPYHDLATFFVQFHRDSVGPDITANFFPGTDPTRLSFIEMMGFLWLEHFGNLVDGEIDQQAFILDLSFNPEITDRLMVVCFNLNREILCVTHES